MLLFKYFMFIVLPYLSNLTVVFFCVICHKIKPTSRILNYQLKTFKKITELQFQNWENL